MNDLKKKIDLEKEVENLSTEELKERTEAMMKESGKNIAKVAVSASFKIWEKKDFREMIKFDSISRTESDRIFNELELTALGLFILHLDYVLSRTVDKARQNVFKSLQDNTQKGFIEIFKELGLEEMHLEQWRGLINMRLKEYCRNYKVALKESKDMKELDKKEDLRVIWARVETLTICGLDHIRRGNVKKEDPLWRFLRLWLTDLDVSFSRLTTTLLGPIAQA